MQQCSKCASPAAFQTPSPTAKEIHSFQCRGCRGTWFPKSHLESWLQLSMPLTRNEMSVHTGIACLSCNKGHLYTTQIGVTGIFFDICSSCEGVFLDIQELRDLKTWASENGQEAVASFSLQRTGTDATMPLRGKESNQLKEFASPKLAYHASKPAHSDLFNITPLSRAEERLKTADGALLAYNEVMLRPCQTWPAESLNFETKNKIDILDPNEVPIGHFAEHEGAATGFFGRLIVGSHRSFSATIWDQNFKPQIAIRRPFYFLFADFFIATADQIALGSVHRQFDLLHSVFEVKDQRRRVIATISRAFWNAKKTEIRYPNAKSQGCLKRSQKDGQQFIEIELGREKLSDEHRALLLAALIATEFNHFERSSGGKS